MKHIKPYKNISEAYDSIRRLHTLYMISDREDLERSSFGYNQRPIWTYPILSDAVNDYMEGEGGYVYEMQVECSIATTADLIDFYAPIPLPDLNAHEQEIKADPKSLLDLLPQLPNDRSIRDFDAIEVGDGVVMLNPGPGIKIMMKFSTRTLDRLAGNL
jgi:hypothetical protein